MFEQALLSGATIAVLGFVLGVLLTLLVESFLYNRTDEVGNLLEGYLNGEPLDWKCPDFLEPLDSLEPRRPFDWEQD